MILKKSLAITGLSLAVFMSAMSGTVGAVPAGSTNKSKGTVPVEQKTTTVSPSIQQLIDKENAITLKAGDIRTYYVNYAKANPDEMLSVRYMPYKFTSVNEAAQKLSSINGQTLVVPTGLPDGFSLQNITLNPVIPRFFSPEYKSLRDQFKAKAQASGKKVYAQSLKWSDTETWISYVRDGQRVNFISAPALTLPEGVTLASLPGDKDEILNINGVEAVYTVFGPHHGDLKVKLVWSSADGSMDYSLTSTKNTTETKAELEAVVAAMAAE